MDFSWTKNTPCNAEEYLPYFTVPQAALLWCGAPYSDLEDIIQNSSQVTRGIYSHYSIPCFEIKCRAIHDAINKGLLQCGRDGNEVPTSEHVAVERRTVNRQNLREWIKKAFPGDKPAFLFDEIERKAHSAISIEAYQTLESERDNLKRQVDILKKELKEIKQTHIKQHKSPARERTLLKVIGALVWRHYAQKTAYSKDGTPVYSAIAEDIVKGLEDKTGVKPDSIRKTILPDAIKAIGSIIKEAQEEHPRQQL